MGGGKALSGGTLGVVTCWGPSLLGVHHVLLSPERRAGTARPHWWTAIHSSSFFFLICKLNTSTICQPEEMEVKVCVHVAFKPEKTSAFLFFLVPCHSQNHSSCSQPGLPPGPRGTLGQEQEHTGGGKKVSLLWPGREVPVLVQGGRAEQVQPPPHPPQAPP